MSGFISEEKIAEIKNASDIVDIVSESVLLKKAGKNYHGLCPFHSEKTPSFTISPDKRIYYCFGCGAGGDVISFVMKSEGISFPQAARTLASRCGVDIPMEKLSPAQKKDMDERERLFMVVKSAMKFFHGVLLSPMGRQGLSYFTKRGITQQTIKTFNLGYAPSGWNGLVDYFSKKKIPLGLAEKAGLVVLKKSGGYYDRFRNRIMFPIFDMAGRVTGFGGRVMDETMPKYYNSPETPIYHKSRSLYGLFHAKNKARESGEAFIVEGYMDQLAMWQNGLQNTVATLGTSMTSDHVRLLKGYASKVVLVYDSDEAGLKAANRSISILNKDMEPRLLVLPDGHDPDSYLAEFGADAFHKQASNALGILDFLILSAKKKHGLDSMGKVKIIDEICPQLSLVDDPVERSIYIDKLSQETGVNAGPIMEKVKKLSSKSSRRPYQNPEPSAVSLGSDSRMEKQIIAMMLQFPEIIPRARKEGLVDYFKNPLLKQLGELIDARSANGPAEPVDLISETDNHEMKQLIASLSLGDEQWDHEACHGLIAQFLCTRRKTKESLLEKIREAESQNNPELLTSLLREKQAMVKKNKFSRSAGGGSI